jgi:hypothetical protein
LLIVGSVAALFAEVAAVAREVARLFRFDPEGWRE